MKKMVVQSVKISKIMAVFAVFLISFLLFPLFTTANIKSLYADTTGSTDSNHPGYKFSTTLATKKATITHYNGSESALSFTIPDKVQINGAGDEYTVTSIGEDTFYNCAFPGSVTIPSGVTSIGNQAFYNCHHMTSIIFTSSIGVTSIGAEAFRQCRNLNSITLPSTVTSIGQDAFALCASLPSITIPSGVSSIELETFNGCTLLETVTFEGSNAPTFADSCFGNTDNPIKANAIAYVPAGSTGYTDNVYPFGTTSGTKNPLTLTVSGSGSGGSSAPRSLTPDEWVAQNHNIDQLANHYGPTPTGFLGMLYDNSMQRIPDTSGLNYWNENLNLQIYGANFVAEHFLFSDEIGAKVAAMTNEDYVNYLYTTLLSRNSDIHGYNNWLGYLNSGFSKEETLRAFLNNEEWINICKLFNVTP